MHELGGLYRKTGNLWINRKIPGAEKNMIWAEIELQSETGHGRWRSHHGPWPSWKQREAAKGALELGLALRWAGPRRMRRQAERGRLELGRRRGPRRVNGAREGVAGSGSSRSVAAAALGNSGERAGWRGDAGTAENGRIRARGPRIWPRWLTIALLEVGSGVVELSWRRISTGLGREQGGAAGRPARCGGASPAKSGRGGSGRRNSGERRRGCGAGKEAAPSAGGGAKTWRWPATGLGNRAGEAERSGGRFRRPEMVKTTDVGSGCVGKRRPGSGPRRAGSGLLRAPTKWGAGRTCGGVCVEERGGGADVAHPHWSEGRGSGRRTLSGRGVDASGGAERLKLGFHPRNDPKFRGGVLFYR